MPRPGFSFLVCPDSRLLQARLEALVSAQGDSGRWERHVHWGDEEPSPRFWEQLTLQGLFGTPRLLVVRAGLAAGQLRPRPEASFPRLPACRSSRRRLLRLRRGLPFRRLPRLRLSLPLLQRRCPQSSLLQ